MGSTIPPLTSLLVAQHANSLHEASYKWLHIKAPVLTSSLLTGMKINGEKRVVGDDGHCFL